MTAVAPTSIRDPQSVALLNRTFSRSLWAMEIAEPLASLDDNQPMALAVESLPGHLEQAVAPHADPQHCAHGKLSSDYSIRDLSGLVWRLKLAAIATAYSPRTFRVLIHDFTKITPQKP